MHGLGVDLVAMCVNDVLTSGARPAFFMDVITCGKVVPERVAELVEGIADGCRQAGCALLGGETAEHPDMMPADDFDLAGFCVGGCERRELISGARCQAGDAVIALASSGPHSNGFSLIRKLLERSGATLDDTPPELGGRSVADALLEPTRIYAEPVRMLVATVDVRAMAHITGGGIPGNVGRPLPAGVGMRHRPLELGAAGGVRLARLARRRGGRDAAGVQPRRRLHRRGARGRRPSWPSGC